VLTKVTVIKIVHTTTVSTTHRCILMDYFNKCNFSKHNNALPDDGVIVTPKHVGAVLI